MWSLCKGSFMSSQVLSVLESARLLGLVYKVLSEHGVCRTQNNVLFLNSSLLLCSLCLSLPISISAFSVFLQSVLPLYTLFYETPSAQRYSFTILDNDNNILPSIYKYVKLGRTQTQSGTKT